MGRLGKRIGPAKLLVYGYGLFAILCALIAWRSQSLIVLAVVFLLTGICIAIVEPKEPSTATMLLGPSSRGLGFGMSASIDGFGDFISSARVGLPRARFGSPVAFGAAAIVTALGTVLLIPTAARLRSAPMIGVVP